MSLNPRDLTQGGQVAFMRLKMCLQINNLISYYVIMGTALFGIAVLLMRMSIQNLTNGIIYWFVWVMSPFTERARGERELDEAIQEAVAEGRGIRQQVREQMLRTEREWVVNVPEKDIELEKTLGGD